MRVFAGNTGDPKAFVQAVEVVREKFHITEAAWSATGG